MLKNLIVIHIDFASKTLEVVCTTYNFFPTLAITQKFKMVVLDIMQSLLWQNILHFLSEALYSRNK